MSQPAIRLDGREGGGPLLRAALSLSLLSQKPLYIDHVRGSGPGLGPRLAACVRAAQAVSAARVEGADLGSSELLFEPGPVRPGKYLLDLGALGSVSQAFEVLAVPLGLTGAPSTVRVLGATHPAAGPSVPYLSLVWAPMLRELGGQVDIELKAAGYEPDGGGEATLHVAPSRPAGPFERRARGTLRDTRVVSAISNLPLGHAARLSARLLQRLKESGIYAEAENLPVPAPRSSGCTCLVAATFERGRVGFAAWGTVEEQPESVADRAADEFVCFIRSRAAVDASLAAQLVVPLAAAAAGLQGPSRPVARFTASAVSDELVALARAVDQFLGVEVAILAGGGQDEAEVRIAPREASLREAIRASRPEL